MIPLVELDAEIGTMQLMGSNGLETYQCLWLWLHDTAHVIPFGPRVQDLIWDHVSGDTISDLTLMPSYVGPGGVHGFVHAGQWLPV